MYQLKNELQNYFPAFLIEDWETPNPNHTHFSIFKSTFYKDLVYNIQILHRINGGVAVIYKNGYPLTNFKFNYLNPQWEALVAFRINNIIQ